MGHQFYLPPPDGPGSLSPAPDGPPVLEPSHPRWATHLTHVPDGPPVLTGQTVRWAISPLYETRQMDQGALRLCQMGHQHYGGAPRWVRDTLLFVEVMSVPPSHRFPKRRDLFDAFFRDSSIIARCTRLTLLLPPRAARIPLSRDGLETPAPLPLYLLYIFRFLVHVTHAVNV